MSLAVSSLKHKRGDVRIDGKVFYKYQKGCKCGERWVTQKQFDKYKKQANSYGTTQYHENTDVWKARNKTWRDGNKEYNSQRSKEWRLNNLERSKATSKKWDDANRQKKKELTSSWRIKNKDRFDKTQKAWRKSNSHIISFHSAKRRKLVESSFVMLHKNQEEIIKTIYKTSSRIGKCIGIPHDVDHRIPLSRGGFHVHTNLQILPATINRRKYNKMPEAFVK